MHAAVQLLKNFRARLQYDEVRVPIQTAAAVLLAYFAAQFMGREDMSWAVFSALFVVQTSIGGTIGAALGRIAGAILGAGLAVGLVIIFGDEEWGTLTALLTGVAVMSFLTAKWPQLAYGLVTVTIIVVAPDFHLMEGAMRKVVAIAIGSICGMVAAFAVFPVRARHSEQAYLAAALRSCGTFILECTACLVGDQKSKNKRTQAVIQRSLTRARTMAEEAAIEDMTPAMGLSPFSESLLPEIERFGYTLTLVDRFSDKPISEKLCEVHKQALIDLAAAVKTSIERIADAVSNGVSCEEINDASNLFSEFAKRVDETLQQGDLSLQDKQHLVAIKGAYESVLANLTDLARQVQCRPTAGQAAT